MPLQASLPIIATPSSSLKDSVNNNKTVHNEKKAIDTPSFTTKINEIPEKQSVSSLDHHHHHDIIEFEQAAVDITPFFLQYPPFVRTLFEESELPHDAIGLYEFFNLHLPAILHKSPSDTMHTVSLQIYHPDKPENKHKFVVNLRNDLDWFNQLISAVHATDIRGIDGKTSIGAMSPAQIHRESYSQQGFFIVTDDDNNPTTTSTSCSESNVKTSSHPMLTVDYSVPPMYHGKGEHYLQHWWFKFMSRFHSAVLLYLFQTPLNKLIQDINGYGFANELHAAISRLTKTRDLYEDGITTNFHQFLQTYLHVTSVEQVKSSYILLMNFLHRNIIEPLHFVLRTVAVTLMWVWGYNLRAEHRIEHRPLEINRKELNEGFLERLVDVIFQYGLADCMSSSVKDIICSAPVVTDSLSTKKKIIENHRFLISRITDALEEEQRFTACESSILDPILRDFAQGICPSYFDCVLAGSSLVEAQRQRFLSESSFSQFPQQQLLTMHHNFGEHENLEGILNESKKMSSKLHKLEMLLHQTAEKNEAILRQRHLIRIPKARKFDPRQDYFVLPVVLSTKYTDAGESLLMLSDTLAIDPILGVFLESGTNGWTIRDDSSFSSAIAQQKENGMIVHYIWENK